MKYKISSSRFITITIFLLAWLFLLPALVFSETSDLLKQAQNLDHEEFFDEAVELWQKIITANPSANITLYAKLKLTTTYSHLGQLHKAVATSKALTESNPDHYHVWFHLGNALARLQQYPEAAEAYLKATQLEPEKGLSRVALAFVYFGDEKPDSAIDQLKKAMKIFKANKNISWYRDCRLAINQIKSFARFPPNFADLWLEKNLKRVQDTYLNAVLELDNLLNQ